MVGEDCDGTVYYNTLLEEELFRQRFSAAISSGKNVKGTVRSERQSGRERKARGGLVRENERSRGLG